MEFTSAFLQYCTACSNVILELLHSKYPPKESLPDLHPLAPPP